MTGRARVKREGKTTQDGETKADRRADGHEEGCINKQTDRQTTRPLALRPRLKLCIDKTPTQYGDLTCPCGTPVEMEEEGRGRGKVKGVRKVQVKRWKKEEERGGEQTGIHRKGRHLEVNRREEEGGQVKEEVSLRVRRREGNEVRRRRRNAGGKTGDGEKV